MQDEDRIRERAHQIWEREGRPEGRHAEHWEQARLEIEAEGEAARAEDAPTPAAPDDGGATPGEAAAAATAAGQWRGSDGGAVSAEPAASSGSPTPTAPDNGGATPAEAAAAAANPTGQSSKGGSRKR